MSSAKSFRTEHLRNSKGHLPKIVTSQKTAPKTVIASKKVVSNCKESKSCSSAVTTIPKRSPIKPKKTTKSDVSFNKSAKRIQNSKTEMCEECGDINHEQKKEKQTHHIVNSNETNSKFLHKPGGQCLRNAPVTKGTIHSKNKANVGTILNKVNVKCVKNDNSIADKRHLNSVRQYFKNDNFQASAESMHNAGHRISLDTIKEVSELHNTSEASIFRIYPEENNDITHFDPDSEDSLKKIKEFRQKNYFECHSAKSRIKMKPNATSLDNHKCVYRFYLNDRLFPVPLNTDYNNKIRCVECHLPMDATNNTVDKINGTIQAKVKFGSKDAQDMLLLLPVKDTLIIEERRKEQKVESEYVYFGVVKLKADGHSVFKSTVPDNSLALKYQKGYKEYADDKFSYKYKEVDEGDVIVI